MNQTSLLDKLIERDRKKILYNSQEGYLIKYSSNLNMILIEVNGKTLEVNRNAVVYSF